MVYLHTKAHVYNSTGPLLTVIKQRANYIFTLFIYDFFHNAAISWGNIASYDRTINERWISKFMEKSNHVLI